MEKNKKMIYMDPSLEIMYLSIDDVITSSNAPYETEDDLLGDGMY